MLVHAMKMIWRRRLRSALLALEIIVAFTLVFATAVFSLHSFELYGLPLGFDARDVWTVTIETGEVDAKITSDQFDNFRQVLLTMPEIKEVTLASTSPYSLVSKTTEVVRNDGDPPTMVEMINASDEFASVMGIETGAGHWYTDADEDRETQVAMVNQQLADKLFGVESPVGKQIRAYSGGQGLGSVFRIVGVVPAFRKGELSPPMNMLFVRVSRAWPSVGLGTMLIKLKPGTTRAFEFALNNQLKSIRNDWRFTITPLAELRKTQQRFQLMPLVIVSVVALFLLVMVGFGLFGVVWQGVQQRIAEFALRRAVGARASVIYLHIVVEQVLFVSLGMAIALMLLVQLPMDVLFGEKPEWKTFVLAAGAAAFMMYGVSILAALVPAWRAARMSPTAGLRHQ